ncbi:hypothetical protein D1164_21725 [Mariniphaga sediminis]|uniref:Glycosyl hydrolase-like 10 domain-containing protein n=1 Tax=Mariniphaga sediminis TaxID=1628158 RepID=A0A399CX46_9BACT|nr:hypothetical protein [Mariniphaga sediminis]RIH63052.1 hypothetical protein D1164_21725 [Mariniphaga sediminis]
MKNNLMPKGIILILFCSLFFVSCGSSERSNNIDSIEKYRELRTEKLHKSRRVIHNNDGCDALYFPVNEKYTVTNFLDKRSAGLIGTDVSTISFCPTASGFGNFTYNTQAGELLVKHGFEFGLRDDTRNITAEMIAEGTDPLKANVEFARDNGFEIFWSNRMNDTHDAAHRVDKPFYLWTKFKENNPQYLFGDVGERLPNGRWSSVDFTHQEVRDRCVQFFKEVCENYDVDGVEMDFLRHFELFKNVGRGGVASQEQLDMLTDMVSQIRKVTEEAGMKRGNPILVLTRIPTSPEYAKRAGVDIERWIEEGLVDIVVGSCYFRLDFWQNFAELGEKDNVKIYAGLSESRVREEHPLLVRQQNSVFRARAAAAWEAGLDGMYSFNEYNSRVRYLCEIGYPEKLAKTNNLYFVTYRDYTASRYLKGGDDFFKMPRLSPTPGNHLKLNSGPFNFAMELGDESVQADVYALVYADDINPGNLTVKVNNSEAEFKGKTEDGLYIFEVEQTAISRGINELYIEGGNLKNDPELKDAALFFCRDKKDIEMRNLIAECK